MKVILIGASGGVGRRHGAGPDLTTLIDGKGVEKAATAAARAGVSRFVLVSAFADSERDKGLGEEFEQSRSSRPGTTWWCMPATVSGQQA